MIWDIVRLFRRMWRSLFKFKLIPQPVPDVTVEDVARIVHRDFPEDQFETVMAMIDEYGIQPWQLGKSRVQLAILKLAQGDIAALKRAIETAKQDSRDVMGPAEYPEYMQVWSQLRQLSGKEQARVIKSDWEQYQNWLRK